MKTSDTATRILTTFLKLIARRGIEATTMRVLAEEAGVNEVTIFRLFTDKETLIREAYERFGPTPRILAYQIALDLSDSRRAAADLVECLTFLYECLNEYPQFLFTGASESWHFPAMSDTFSSHYLAAHQLIEQALIQAAPLLRPDINRETTTLSLLGLIMMTIFWQYHNWKTITDEECKHRLTGAVHLLMSR